MVSLRCLQCGILVLTLNRVAILNSSVIHLKRKRESWQTMKADRILKKAIRSRGLGLLIALSLTSVLIGSTAFAQMPPLQSETSPTPLETPGPITIPPSTSAPSSSNQETTTQPTETTAPPPEVQPEVPVQDARVAFRLGDKVATIRGQRVELIAPPTVIEGTTLLPLRVVAADALGASVFYDPKTRQIAITMGESKLRLILDSKIAYLNGEVVRMSVPPQVIEGVTLLPLRFISEQMGLTIAFDPVTKIITFDTVGAKLPDPNQPPVSSFFFPTAYIAGQAIDVIDQSYDPEGDKLVARQWRINGDNNTIATTLGQNFSKPKPGLYDIGMRVKDAKGNWSAWTSAMVSITANQVPVVTDITTSRETYQRGELIDYQVNYVNEPWEQIVREKWSYRKSSDTVSQPIFAKPKRIFDEGEYTIMLQVQDQYGHWSSKYERRIRINSILNFKEFAFKFSNGELGETIANFSGFNFLDYKDAPKQQWTGVPGILFFSNSPEMVTQKGILYQDRIIGGGRAVIHHIHNFANDPVAKKLVVLVYNDSDVPQVLETSNMVMLDPSSDILYLGQQLLLRYFQGRSASSIVIQPRSSVVLYESNGNKWSKGTAISGMFDFNATSELRMAVGVLDRSESPELLAQYGFPPRDVHPRGTFSTLDENIYVDLTGITEPTKVIVGKSQEEWLVGADAVLGTMVTNRGNFGLEYHIVVTAQERTAVILNPRGAIYNGAIKWVNGPAFMAPSDGFFVGGKDRAAFIGIVDAGQTREFTYMLPNGSASPVLFGFIPQSHWK